MAAISPMLPLDISRDVSPMQEHDLEISHNATTSFNFRSEPVSSRPNGITHLHTVGKNLSQNGGPNLKDFKSFPVGNRISPEMESTTDPMSFTGSDVTVTLDDDILTVQVETPPKVDRIRGKSKSLDLLGDGARSELKKNEDSVKNCYSSPCTPSRINWVVFDDIEKIGNGKRESKSNDAIGSESGFQETSLTILETPTARQQGACARKNDASDTIVVEATIETTPVNMACANRMNGNDPQCTIRTTPYETPSKETMEHAETVGNGHCTSPLNKGAILGEPSQGKEIEAMGSRSFRTEDNARSFSAVDNEFKRHSSFLNPQWRSILDNELAIIKKPLMESASNIPSLLDANGLSSSRMSITAQDIQRSRAVRRLQHRFRSLSDGGDRMAKDLRDLQMLIESVSAATRLQQPIMPQDGRTASKMQIDPEIQVKAPSLPENKLYHTYFCYHHNDRDWVLNVIERLESPNMDFKCCFYERDFDPEIPEVQNLARCVRVSTATVIVISPDFLNSQWCTNMTQMMSDMDQNVRQKIFIPVMLQNGHLPSILRHYNHIDANNEQWWTKFLLAITFSEESDVACGMLTLQCKTHLQSGQVLSTLKSSCGCCGGEYIDQANVPEDLSSAGIQITQKEYEQAISLLMKDCKFHCHVCCYNIPLAIIIFLLLLVFCLVVIPLLDSLVLQGMALGFELMHGIILWLGLLVTYLLVTWVFKRHMGRRVNGRLAKANAIFMQYDVLAGVEELSVVNCNKYFLHFIYFETGPCMSYLQELLTTLEEHSHSYLNQTFEGEDTAVECENGQVINDSIEVDFSQHRAIDRIRVLPGKYNKPVQTQAETLLLQHSGEYVRQLITNKIPTPRKNRHAQQIQCLCQFVEKSVYKVDV